MDAFAAENLLVEIIEEIKINKTLFISYGGRDEIKAKSTLALKYADKYIFALLKSVAMKDSTFSNGADNFIDTLQQWLKSLLKYSRKSLMLHSLYPKFRQIL